MLRNVTHPRTRASHRAHAKHYRRTWVLMALLMCVTLALGVYGSFDSVSWPELMSALLTTAYRLLAAYIMALMLGVTIALLVSWSPFADMLFPVFDVLQNIPSFALIPIFIYFFGYTSEMIILFAASSIAWPILFAVMTAIKGAHRDLLDAAAIFGARGLKRILFFLAPLSFPAILTGSIVGIAIGWEAVIGAEIITNVLGFGDFIKNASIAGFTQASVAGTLAILVIVFAINRMVWAPLLAESSKRYAE